MKLRQFRLADGRNTFLPIEKIVAVTDAKTPIDIEEVKIQAKWLGCCNVDDLSPNALRAYVTERHRSVMDVVLEGVRMSFDLADSAEQIAADISLVEFEPA